MKKLLLTLLLITIGFVNYGQDYFNDYQSYESRINHFHRSFHYTSYHTEFSYPVIIYKFRGVTISWVSWYHQPTYYYYDYYPFSYYYSWRYYASYYAVSRHRTYDWWTHTTYRSKPQNNINLTDNHRPKPVVQPHVRPTNVNYGAKQPTKPIYHKPVNYNRPIKENRPVRVNKPIQHYKKPIKQNNSYRKPVNYNKPIKKPTSNTSRSQKVYRTR